jgi:hypothetical protein
MLKMMDWGMAAIFAVQLCVAAQAQDIAKTQRSLVEIQETLTRIRLLAPALTEQERSSALLAAVPASVSEEIQEIKSRVTSVEQDLMKAIIAEFVDLPVRTDTAWRAAPRHGGFLPVLPRNLAVISEADVTIIKKTGSAVGRFPAPSPTYHVCPAIELTDGDRLSIRISIPTTASGDGDPVPYYGVRDGQGNEFVLGFLSASGEERTLWIQCLGTDAMALADGKLETQGHRVDDLVPPLFVFFHMNDTAQLNVHELRLGGVQERVNKD